MGTHWGSLLEVLVVSLAVTVVVVVVFSLGVAAWSRAVPAAARRDPRAPRAPLRSRTAAAEAVLCFVACLAIAAYGIGLIVPG